MNPISYQDYEERRLVQILEYWKKIQQYSILSERHKHPIIAVNEAGEDLLLQLDQQTKEHVEILLSGKESTKGKEIIETVQEIINLHPHNQTLGTRAFLYYLLDRYLLGGTLYRVLLEIDKEGK